MVFKKVLLAAAASAALASAGTAQAGTIITNLLNGDQPGAFAGPAGNTTTFNGGALGAGLALTGTGVIVNGSATAAQPAYSDGSQFLAVLANQSATLKGIVGYGAVSFFLGSIDDYNTVEILNTAGTVIGTFTGIDFTANPNGNQVLPNTNRRITIGATAGDSIGGIRVTSSQNSAEVDNVTFLSAVPEPSTWMMMIFGFGVVGYSLRARRRSSLPAFS